MGGTRVCFAGYTAQGECIRPVLRQGIDESVLHTSTGVVAPFHMLEIELYPVSSMPPHCEDWGFHDKSLKITGRLLDKERYTFLHGILHKSVECVFERPIHRIGSTGFLLSNEGGPRSLGTILPHNDVMPGVTDKDEGGMRFRLTFTDGDGAHYELAVNDLAWRYYWTHQRTWGKWTVEQTQAQMRTTLAACTVYLRIGLARGWKQQPDRCYLQVTGIHTFPDYLEGQTFANFAPRGQG